MRIVLLAADEVRRSLASRRGLLSVLGFALLWALVLWYVVRPAALLDGREGGGGGDLLLAVAERFGFQALLDWPSAQLAAGWVVALWLLPIIALTGAVDQIASDRARGTLRYLVLRASRTEICTGRWLGQAIVQAGLVALALGSTLGFVAVQTPDRLAGALTVAPFAALSLWCALLPWVALASLVSVLAPSARRATLLAFGLYVALSWFSAFATSRLDDARALPGAVRAALDVALRHLVPGAVNAELLAAGARGAVLASGPALVQAALLVALATLVFRRRAL